MIQIFGHKLYRQFVFLYHIAGVSKHKITVGLQMNQSVRLQKLTITFHKVCGSKTFSRFLHLRIRESQPYLTHLTRSKKTVDDFDIGTQKSHIRHAIFQRFRRTGPHTGPFYIYTDKIFIGIHTTQPYGIFTSSASQFQNYRIIVLKKVTVPIPLHIERNVIGHRIRVFKHVRILPHISKFLQFSFSHEN